MAQVKKGGKMPISAKQAIQNAQDNDFSILRVEPELRKELEEKGYAIRWINAPKYRQGGNFHRSGWKALQFDMSKEGAKASKFGATAEGFIIRHDMMLAVKRSEDQELHRARIQNRTRQMSFNQDNAKEQLQEAMGGKGKVYAGYDENGDN